MTDCDYGIENRTIAKVCSTAVFRPCRSAPSGKSDNNAIHTAADQDPTEQGG